VADLATLVTTAVAAGHCKWAYDAKGTFYKFGSQPAGEVTGDFTAIGPVAPVPGIAGTIAALLVDSGAAVGSLVACKDFLNPFTGTSTDTLYAGLLITDGTTTFAQAIAQIAAYIGGWVFVCPDMASGTTTEFHVDNLPFDDSNSSVVATIPDSEIIDIQKLGNPKGLGEGVPIWSLTWQYEQQRTVQTSGLAATVSLSKRNLYGNEHQQVVAKDASVLTTYPLAQAIVISGDAWAIAVTDMQAGAQNFFTALKTPRDWFKVVVKLTPSLLTPVRMGTTSKYWCPAVKLSWSATDGVLIQPVIGLLHPRFGFATTGAGTHFHTMAISLDLNAKEITYVGWTTYRAG